MRTRPIVEQVVGPDIVDVPQAGPGRTHGGYRGRVLRRSPLTQLIGTRRRPVERLTAAVDRLHRRQREPTA